MHSCYILLQLKLWAETFTNILAQGTKQKAAFRVRVLRVLRVLRVSPISWSTLPRARPEMNCNLTACLRYVESNYLAKLRRKVQVSTLNFVSDSVSDSQGASNGNATPWSRSCDNTESYTGTLNSVLASLRICAGKMTEMNFYQFLHGWNVWKTRLILHDPVWFKASLRELIRNRWTACKGHICEMQSNQTWDKRARWKRDRVSLAMWRGKRGNEAFVGMAAAALLLVAVASDAFVTVWPSVLCFKVL